MKQTPSDENGSDIPACVSAEPLSRPWYQRGYRRVLVDMHLTDQDPEILSLYEPSEMVKLYETAGVSSAMVYAQSHVGLCYWPTQTGVIHKAMGDRDWLGEILGLLREREIASVVYYSVIFNNQEFLRHPEWRMVDCANRPFTRYGHLCPNNPEYRAFCRKQIEELLSAYAFDGLFYDMTFWPRVCVCPACRVRFREETGHEIPDTINWYGEHWCGFQAAREAWMTEFAAFLTKTAKALRPDLSVYHNFATSQAGWCPGVAFESAAQHDFLGADFYGDATEQLVVSKLLSGLTPNQPIEFMTSRCVDLRDHEQTKRPEELEMQAMAALHQGGAFLFIDAINPDGTATPEVYAAMRSIYRNVERYEPLMQGDPVEDIAVYFSNESKMDFRDNGKSFNQSDAFNDTASMDQTYPHLQALRGVCRMLNRAHMPFGVMTRRQLKTLSRYRAVILPNVLRMDAEEVEAIREYVRNGGNVYASRYTSLTEARGTRHDDFLLADVFGCHYAADDLAHWSYIKPEDDALKACAKPQRYLSHLSPSTPKWAAGMLRLKPEAEGCVLGSYVAPYSIDHGTVFDRNWVSIHSSPPWKETGVPAVVENAFGRGHSIYSSADIECIDSTANEKFFLELIRRLVGDDPLTFCSTAHPSVWMAAYHEPDKRRYRVTLLNYQTQLPAIPLPAVAWQLQLPPGCRATRVVRLPDGDDVTHTCGATGRVDVTLPVLAVFAMLAVEYKREP